MLPKLTGMAVLVAEKRKVKDIYVDVEGDKNKFTFRQDFIFRKAQ